MDERKSDHNNEKLSFLELLYGIFFQPRLTFKNIALTTPLFYAFLIFTGVNISTTLVGLLTVPGSSLSQSLGADLPLELQQFLEFFTSSAFTTMGTFFSLIFSLIMWFLLAAVLNLFAELFGGKGTGIGVLTVLGFATLPQVLVIPFEVFFYLLGIPSGFLALISIPLFIWTQLVLPVIGIRAVHKFSSGRAVLTVLTPLVLTLGLIITVAVSFVTLIAPFLG